jgi:hypothetical protein
MLRADSERADTYAHNESEPARCAVTNWTMQQIIIVREKANQADPENINGDDSHAG